MEKKCKTLEDLYNWCFKQNDHHPEYFENPELKMPETAKMELTCDLFGECKTLEDLYNWCLRKHYKNNDHHPEHFENPEFEMPETAKMELTCDLLGSVLGNFQKQQIPVSISECRYVIENENWKNWKYALKENLPVVSNTVPNHNKRWSKKFADEEKKILEELFEKLKNGMSIYFIDKELKKLECVQYYLEDLEYHKAAVYTVWGLIPAFHFPGMKKKIAHHDDDKRNTIMILGYTAHWCFEDKT